MDGRTTIKYLQAYIKARDHHPALCKDYFLKLSEEVGELAEAIRKNVLQKDTGTLKGTIDEEVWDVIYYAVTLANCYEIDIESVMREKLKLSEERYPTDVVFELDR